MSTINLLPEDYQRRRARRRANVLCLLLFAVVMTGVLAAGAVSDQHSRNTHKVCDQVNASYAEAAKLIDLMRRLQEQKTRLLAKAEQASALQERVPRSYVLGTLANACPPQTGLLRIQLLTKAGEAERVGKFNAVAAQRSGKAPPLFVDLLVSGQARTDVEVAKFIANLARNPLLTNVDLVFSDERVAPDKSLFREFQVRMEIRPGVDVLDVIGPPAEATHAEPPAATPRAEPAPAVAKRTEAP